VVCAFQLDHEDILDQDIRIVLTNALALVENGKTRLRGGSDTP